ncbi:predicted Fe-S oxidoreductase [Desulfurococcaceae archaeon AG1]|jgi:Fe-S oxidoreductase|nr:MAG: (Fe-S)-binding protein [Desulfurococcaceae archaeon]GAY26442.1 predicted Fe-S oxidoreductase [Desulfurococcaceae archaeon AG1]
MPLKLDDIVSIIRENIARKGNPIGIDPEVCSSWARDLGIPRESDTIIYTSCMYQSVPYLIELVNMLERLEKGPRIFTSLGVMLAKTIDVASIAGKRGADMERFNNMIRNIVLALRKQGLNIGYLYEEEPYSGSLLYELGLEDDFTVHAKKVFSLFKERGVKKIIAIDPHTYYILSKVYPKYIDGYDIQVIHYIEALDPSKLGKISGEAPNIVIHDPCLLARFSRIVEPQRNLLKSIGVNVKEPHRSGLRTRCCGGPIEALSPTLSRRIGEQRVEELSRLERNIVVMCPICFSNISRLAEKYGAKVMDLSEFIHQ